MSYLVQYQELYKLLIGQNQINFVVNVALRSKRKKRRAMICTKCDADPVYPRIAPCVITLIHKENEVLLAHNINFPENFYSTLAGLLNRRIS